LFSSCLLIVLFIYNPNIRFPQHNGNDVSNISSVAIVNTHNVNLRATHCARTIMATRIPLPLSKLIRRSLCTIAYGEADRAATPWLAWSLPMLGAWIETRRVCESVLCSCVHGWRGPFRPLQCFSDFTRSTTLGPFLARRRPIPGRAGSNGAQHRVGGRESSQPPWRWLQTAATAVAAMSKCRR